MLFWCCFLGSPGSGGSRTTSFPGRAASEAESPRRLSQRRDGGRDWAPIGSTLVAKPGNYVEHAGPSTHALRDLHAGPAAHALHAVAGSRRQLSPDGEPISGPVLTGIQWM